MKMDVDASKELSGAFEAIKVLGRELQYSKERIKQLEDALGGGPADFNADTERILSERAATAEARALSLEEELEQAQNQHAKMTARNVKLRAKVDKLKVIKQEQGDGPIESGGVAEVKANFEAEIQKHVQDKQRFQKSVDELEKRLGQMRKQLDAKNREADNLRRSLQNRESNGKVWSIEMYIAYSQDIPKFSNRPECLSLQPICRGDSDIRAWLEKDKDYGWIVPNFLCLPNPARLLWTSTSCQAGLAFGPMHQYHGPRHGWVKQSEFAGRYGKELELFFVNGEHIYYAGRYLCKDIRSQNPLGCLRSGKEAAIALAELTVPLRVAGDQAACDALRASTERLYREEILHAECALLLCVGFDHKLHDALSKRYKSLTDLEKKRARDILKAEDRDDSRAPLSRTQKTTHVKRDRNER